MNEENKHARDFGLKGCIVKDWYEDGVRRLILNMKGSHFTQYIGIPKGHPLAGFSYDDIPLNCHYGLTFSGEGEGKLTAKDFYWYGWDYAHSGDYTYFEKMKNDKLFKKSNNEKDWTFKEVIEDGRDVVYDFKRLIKLSERITNKLTNK